MLTSDRPPKEMTALEDRLKTRFEWGLLADIQPPDYETRMAIIKNKAMQLGTPLPDSICTYIAENVTANVRQIEGTVKKILAYRELLGNDIDEESTARAVRDMLKKGQRVCPSASLVISEISKYYNLEERVLRGQQRFKEAATARQVAMYLIRRLTNLSLSEIGKEFDGRDHTTVMHSIEKVEKQMNKSPAFAETVKAITANINAKKLISFLHVFFHISVENSAPAGENFFLAARRGKPAKIFHIPVDALSFALSPFPTFPHFPAPTADTAFYSILFSKKQFLTKRTLEGRYAL